MSYCVAQLHLSEEAEIGFNPFVSLRLCVSAVKQWLFFA